MEHKLWFMGTSYVPGEARTLIDNLEDSAHREMARAEFYYFRGESEKAAEISEKYLQDEDLVFRMSACLIYIFSSIFLLKFQKAVSFKRKPVIRHKWKKHL